MKKATLSMEVLKWVLLGLIFIIVFFPIVNRLFGLMQVQAQDTKCATSVALASQVVKDMAGDPPGIFCPTGEVEIKSNEHDLNKRKNDVFDQILYSMYRCGSKFGFENGKAKYNPFAFQGKACVFCDNLVFDEKVKALEEQRGLLLRSAEKTIPNKRITFFEHFNGAPPTTETLSDLKQLNDVIDFNEEQSVVFVMHTDSNYDNLVKGMALGGAGGGVLGGTAGGVAGAVGAGAILSLIPGVNVGFWTLVGVGFAAGVVTGAVSGGVAGSRIDPTYPASVIVMPNDYAKLEEMGCKILGNGYENPFGIQIE